MYICRRHCLSIGWMELWMWQKSVFVCRHRSDSKTIVLLRNQKTINSIRIRFINFSFSRKSKTINQTLVVATPSFRFVFHSQCLNTSCGVWLSNRNQSDHSSEISYIFTPINADFRLNRAVCIFISHLFVSSIGNRKYGLTAHKHCCSVCDCRWKCNQYNCKSWCFRLTLLTKSTLNNIGIWDSKRISI